VRICLFLVAATLAAAQSVATSSTVDINGNRVPGTATVATDGIVTDLRQSINGREVPLEQIEQKVLSTDGNTTVTERIIRHYGANGVVVATDRVVTEETKTGEGESTVRATTYRSDLNGNVSAAERKTVETHKQGDTVVTDTAVEKKSLSGSMEVAEKRASTTEPDGTGTRESETVMLRNANGDLYEAQRSTTTETKTDDQVVRNKAVYEPNVDGQLLLTRQEVAKSVTKPDGSSTQEVEVFGRTSNGKAHDPGSPLPLTEKRTIDRNPGPGGEIVEKQTVQIPSANDPGRLQPARTVSETVCRGECDQKPQPVIPSPPASKNP
jgi:hypothetical protein